MQPTLYMKDENDEWTAVAGFTGIPEFMPHTEDSNEVFTLFTQSMSVEFSIKNLRIAAKNQKWWLCFYEYGPWRTKGPIQLRTLKKAKRLKWRMYRG